MAEEDAQRSAAGLWREKPAQLIDPSTLWPWMRFFVLLALIDYLLVAGLALTTAGVWVGWVTLDIDAATIVDSALLVASNVLTPLFAICAFFTCRMTYRLMKNVHAWAGGGDLITPGWAVGWYFIPFANLVMPVRAVHQIWRETMSRVGRPDRGSPIPAWWACYLGGGVVATLGAYLIGVASVSQAPEAVARSLVVMAAGFAMRAVAAGLLIAIFGALTRAQASLKDDLAEVFS
jgi:hypothetical protein